MSETNDEAREILQDLASCGVDIVTIGQYLKPEKQAKDVQRFVTPEEFDSFAEYGRLIGIPHIYSAPFIRSSYLADEVLLEARQMM